MPKRGILNPVLLLRLMPLAAVAVSIPDGHAANSVTFASDQKIVVEDSVAQASNNVGAVQVFASGGVPGSSIVAEYNNNGTVAGSTVYALGKLAGFWSMVGRNVGVQGHITGMGSGGWGTVGSYGGYLNPGTTGIDAPSAWGALGGNDGSNTWAVYANGAQFSTSGTLWVTSDERLKQDIADIDDALGLVRELRPSRFGYRADYRDKGIALPEDTQYGFVAQDLETVLPSLVREVQLPFAVTDPDSFAMQEAGQPEAAQTYKAIQILGLIPFLTRAIQQLDAKVADTLAQANRENAALKARLAQLEASVQAMQVAAAPVKGCPPTDSIGPQLAAIQPSPLSVPKQDVSPR